MSTTDRCLCPCYCPAQRPPDSRICDPCNRGDHTIKGAAAARDAAKCIEVAEPCP